MKFTKNFTKSGSEYLLEVNIILNDLKGNKTPYFSITGKIYPTNKPWYTIANGCIHDLILEFAPEFSDVIKLHMADINGIPMYAVDNGWYWIEKENIPFVKSHFRISTNEAKHLIVEMQSKDDVKIYCKAQRNRWLKEAASAILKYDIDIVES